VRPQQGDIAMRSYVASVCFKYFRHFQGMLQLSHINIVKLDRRCCTCCKCFRGMLQVF
jgi:hypothetical protein